MTVSENIHQLVDTLPEDCLGEVLDYLADPGDTEETLSTETEAVIEEGLTTSPTLSVTHVSPAPLTGHLRKSRVAGWRIIFPVEDGIKVVAVATIEPRSQARLRTPGIFAWSEW